MNSGSKKYQLGLVLGKFMPPHHGHRLVIQTALAQSNRVVIVVCEQVGDKISVEQRVEWLKKIFPQATIKILEVNFPVTDAQEWADGVLKTVGEKPDAVFSSEDYGTQLAELIGCTHVMVDKNREQVPVSGGEILKNLKSYKYFVDPIVYKYLQKS